MLELRAHKGYYKKFIDGLSNNERAKFLRALLLLKRSDEDEIPRHYIKYISDGINEFRVTFGNNELRLFFFRDGDKLVILLNGFRKKTQKTPKSEIEKAKRLKKEYYGQV